MLLSDYVIDFISRKNVRDLFLVSGGGIMYLLDSVGRNRDVHYYCNYHEQACVGAAEGYALATNGLGVCLATTGPGTANAISGLPAAYVDSIPVMVICGNVKRELIGDHSKVRQIGPQETNLLDMARPVCKYVKGVRDPKSIRYELEYAYHAAVSERPGPVLLELPLDVQGADVDPDTLVGFEPPAPTGNPHLKAAAQTLLQELRSAKRPVFVFGNGVLRADAQEQMRSVLSFMHVPVVLPSTSKDLLEEEHPLNFGIFGNLGQRRANFVTQNSDLMVAFAAGLNVVKVGFNVEGFAPKARKIFVDIDEAQLKHQVVRPDIAIQADVKDFFAELLCALKSQPYRCPQKWFDACTRWRERYPILTSDYFSDEDHVNSYVFWNKLADFVEASDTIVTGNALDTTSYVQAYRVRRGQRTFNSGWGSMGWCLPMAIGACIAKGRARTICVTGDGSFQFNVQELLTIAHYRLPIKIFVLNNKGYSNIRGTQESFFEGRYVGSDPASGVANPDYAKLASAYALWYSKIERNAGIEEGVRFALNQEGPGICELNASAQQRIFPKATASRRPDGTFESRPLEDMAPLLSREELWENMHQFDDD